MSYHAIIKTSYSKTQSYAETGRQYGISRQRVHQIVKEYKNLGVSGRERLYKLAWKDTCQICLKNPTNALHHKNKNNKDDSKENLIAICIPCHKEVHLSKIGKKRKEYFFSKKTWTRNHLNKCNICNKKYYARGLCKACYQIIRKYHLRTKEKPLP